MLRHGDLSRQPKVFQSKTGLRVAEFDELVAAVLPTFERVQEARLSRRPRPQALGGGRHIELAPKHLILLVADDLYSGKQQRHTLKSQITVGEDGKIVECSARADGGHHPAQAVGRAGPSCPWGRSMEDLGYLGSDQVHPEGLGATPRKKPRSLLSILAGRTAPGHHRPGLFQACPRCRPGCASPRDG